MASRPREGASPIGASSPLQVFPVDWGALAPLRLRARALADGVFAGAHRSQRKGGGVEFGGQRPYVPGDDLRFFDRRSLLRHDKLLIREFLTDTDRSVWLVVDASASMAFRGAPARGPRAPGAKLAYAGLLAAALARVAVASGDPVGLVFLGGDKAAPVPLTGGREGFARVVSALEAVAAAGELVADEEAVARAVGHLARKARRGSIVVVLSDLVDLAERALPLFASLASHGRTLAVVRVLDPVEATFAVEGHVRLRSLEGRLVVEADADAARGPYLARLAAVADAWRGELEARGGRFVDVVTTDPPEEALRQLVRGVAGSPVAPREPRA